MIKMINRLEIGWVLTELLEIEIGLMFSQAILQIKIYAYILYLILHII